MELIIKVDDQEGPFLIELLKKFSFVKEVLPTEASAHADELWQVKAQKLFASKADFELWLATPNAAVQQLKPVDLLATENGYQLVQKLIGRLEHGIMA